eukprot:Rhum_TRINITY_DN9218_c0_g1::Rhum_TRINITY_DN9218_c0_g1_i1::g.32463::m.32463
MSAGGLHPLERSVSVDITDASDPIVSSLFKDPPREGTLGDRISSQGDSDPEDMDFEATTRVRSRSPSPTRAKTMSALKVHNGGLSGARSADVVTMRHDDEVSVERMRNTSKTDSRNSLTLEEGFTSKRAQSWCATMGNLRDERSHKVISFNLENHRDLKVRAPVDLPMTRNFSFQKVLKHQQELSTTPNSVQPLSVPKKRASLLGASCGTPLPHTTPISDTPSIISPLPPSSVCDTPLPPAPEEEDEEPCPICCEEDGEGDGKAEGWAEVGNCRHRFHCICILEYLRFSNRYECPMCNGEIGELLLYDGEVLDAKSLKEQFYSPPADVIFRSLHNISFFEEKGEVKSLPLVRTANEHKEIVQQAAFPTVILQLVDSEGRDCTLNNIADDITIEVTNDCSDSTCYNNTGKVQSDGRATINNMVLQINKSRTISEEDHITLEFRVKGEGVAELMPCNDTVIRGVVNFPTHLRESTLKKRPKGNDDGSNENPVVDSVDGDSATSPVATDPAPTPTAAAPAPARRPSPTPSSSSSPSASPPRNRGLGEKGVAPNAPNAAGAKRQQRPQARPATNNTGACSGCVIA